MIEAILAGLAGWRVASLLVNEQGPWDAFERLRLRVGIPPQGEAGVISSNPLAGVLSCIWCASFWCAAACWVFGEFVAWEPVALIAAAAVAVMVSVWTDSGRRLQ